MLILACGMLDPLPKNVFHIPLCRKSNLEAKDKFLDPLAILKTAFCLGQLTFWTLLKECFF